MSNTLNPTSLTSRFESKIEREANTGCWLWSGSMDRHGYGLFLCESRGRPRFAHRVSFELHCGPIPAGLNVCHHCDTPACVNPAHLFLGTQKDNIQDASRKQRTPLGERQGSSKLKNEDVLRIRALAATGSKQRDIAAMFGIAQPTVCEIVSGKRWPHLPLSRHIARTFKPREAAA